MGDPGGGRLLVLAAAVVCVAAFAATSGASQPGDSGDRLSASEIVVTVELRPNGTAAWTIAYHYRLDTDDRRRGFERLSEQIGSQRDSYESAVREDVAGTVRLAENRTGRSMSLSAVSARTYQQSIPRAVGVVVHQFVWDRFAAVEGGQLRAGDAIRGFYLGPRTVLTIRWPEQYDLADLQPPADERTDTEATWRSGEFDADEPTVVLDSGTPGPPTRMLGAAGMLVLFVGSAAIAYVRRGRPPIPSVLREGALTDSSASPGDDGRAMTGDGQGDVTSQTPDQDAKMPAGPLSDEERVLWVLDEHGGRVKQQTIAAECDWGDSKTSRVITRLHEEGKVTRFRLGRENVISLPEERYDE